VLLVWVCGRGHHPSLENNSIGDPGAAELAAAIVVAVKANTSFRKLK
jgi:hypothetical protein